MGFLLRFLAAIFFLGNESEVERRKREWQEAEREGRVGTKVFGDMLAGVFGTVLLVLFIYSMLTQGLLGVLRLMVIYQALMFVALFGLILTILFRPEYGFAARVGVYLVLAVLALTMFTHRDHKPRASHPKREVVSRPAPEKPFERAEWIVRDELVARVDQLRAEAQARWKADIVAAGATDAAGVVPPMLEVTAKSPRMWQVKNLSKATVCVRLARVSQPDYGKGRWLHCSLDAVHECSELLAGSTRRLALEGNDRVAGCASTLLEYRVGTFSQPEPSWWSATALDELDETSSLSDRGHVKWTLEQLRNEISVLEKLLAQPDRAARWRRELAEITK